MLSEICLGDHATQPAIIQFFKEKFSGIILSDSTIQAIKAVKLCYFYGPNNTWCSQIAH